MQQTKSDYQFWRVIGSIIIAISTLWFTGGDLPLVRAAAGVCQVTNAGKNLRLRAGPSTNYAIQTSFDPGVKLTPIGRNANSQWMQVRTQNNITGWVNTNPAWLNCNIAVGTLPIQSGDVFGPDAGKPDPPPYVVLPSSLYHLNAPQVTQGLVIYVPEDAKDKTSSVVFSDRVDFKAVLAGYAPDEVRNVQFKITDVDQTQTFYDHTESSADYCAFGGDGPACNTLALTRRATWPGSHNRVQDGEYLGEVTATLRNGETRQRTFYFNIDRAASASAGTGTAGSSAAPAGDVIRIRFATGAVADTVTGALPAGGRQDYILGAAAGQTMTVELYPADAGLTLAIGGADGAIYKAADNVTTYTFVLPARQDYLLSVIAGGSAANYTLVVTII